MNKSVTTLQINQAVRNKAMSAEYKQGTVVKDLAVKYKLAVSSVYEILRNQGASARQSNEHKQNILAIIDGGMLCKHAAELFSIPLPTLLKWRAKKRREEVNAYTNRLSG